MNHRPAAHRLAIMMLGAFFAMAATVRAQDPAPWNRMYLVIFAGQVANAAKLESLGNYQAVNTRNELIYGVGLGIPVTPSIDCDLAYSLMNASAKQPSSVSDDYLKMDIAFKGLSCTGRKKYSFSEDRFVPWWGGGLDATLLTMDETEVRTAASGQFIAAQSTRVTMAAGAHAAAGINIYPVPQSAIAITLEGRYTGYFTTGLLDGDINAWSFIAGLRWDFWQLGR